MHTSSELDMWNRRRTDLVREAEGAWLKRSLRQARRAKVESSANSAEHGAPMSWRFWIRGHRTA